MDGNGANPGDHSDPALETFPAISAYVHHLITERPALREHRESLYQLAGMAARFGYVQAQEDLRKRTIPITLTEPLTGYTELEGQEAQAFLAELGLGSKDGT